MPKMPKIVVSLRSSSFYQLVYSKSKIWSFETVEDAAERGAEMIGFAIIQAYSWFSAGGESVKIEP